MTVIEQHQAANPECLENYKQNMLLLTDTQLNELTGISSSSWRKSRMTGYILGVPAPRHIKFGKSVRYRLADIQDWLEGLDQNGKEGM
ncbi:MAG: hypothetical protein ABNH03_02725 [Alteromonas sp.]|jgi:predicted DNA-binding transcriptional regulator AlpA|uniref:helix-turn-helix transcriptional regulator n=1 Tax=Alteromonas sp. TaxID=232 RepID=UPI0032D8CF12